MESATAEISRDDVLSSMADWAPSGEESVKPAEKPVEATDSQAAKAEAKPTEPAAKSAEGKDSKEVAAKADTKVEAEKPAEPAKSKYAQENERKQQTWEKINADKEALKAEREKLAKEREEFQRTRVSTEIYRDKHGSSAKDYRDLGKEFVKKGDSASAEACEQLAVKLEQEHQQALAKADYEKKETEWRGHYETLAEKHPDLRDPKTELFKETAKALEDFPHLQKVSDGIKYAVKLADINLREKAFDGTKTELAKLKEDYAKLQKKLSIGGGSPTSEPTEPKSFNDMSPAEQRRHLEQASEQIDRAAGFE